MKKFLILVLVIISFLLVVLVDRYQISLARAEMRSRHESQADIISLKLQNAVNERIKNAEYLKALYELHPDTSAEEFADFSDNLMRFNPSIRALQLTDRTTQVIYAYPPKGNEITISEPMVLINDPVRRSYVKKALEQRRMTVQPPFELRQGGLGIIARNPVFSDEEFIGLAIIVINIDNIIADGLNQTDPDIYRLELADSAGNVFFSNYEGGKTISTVRRFYFADTFWLMDLYMNDSFGVSGGYRRTVINLLMLGVLVLLILLIYTFSGRADFLKREVEKQILELNESEGRFKLAVENTKAGYFVVDLQGRFIQVNRAWLEMHGYDSEAEVLGKHFSLTQPDADRTKAEDLVKTVLSGNEIPNGEFSRLCRDGSIKYHSYTATPVFRNGEPAGIEGFIFDISERKAAEQEKDYLMKELNHRVKNNLLMVSSLVQLKDSSIGGAADLTDIKNQIDSIRLIHEKLHQTGDVSHIAVSDYFHELLQSIFATFTTVPVKIIAEIDQINLDVKSAVTLGLLINEIATNAVKHAFSRQPDGWFRIEFKKESTAGIYLLRLSNSGLSFPEHIGLDNPETLGLRLISALTSQMRGTVELRKTPETLFVIKIPV